MKDYGHEIMKAALEYSDNFLGTEAFIAGVNSKIAEKIKIEFAIEQFEIEESWDDIFEKHQQEYGSNYKAVSLNRDWLKRNFHPPKRKTICNIYF